MNALPRVLILGATGRTGSRVLAQLLEHGVPVRAIVRSAARLPTGSTDDPRLEVVEADLLELPAEELAEHLAGCGTVISCLGHPMSLRGIFGPPRDLVTEAVHRVRAAVETHQRARGPGEPPASPVRLILMSSVSVNEPGHADTHRGRAERAYMWAMRVAVPPARDNQRAADALDEIGRSDPRLQWTAVRPDSLVDGDVAKYVVHGGLVASLFKPDHTRMANVAHFMCELATDEATWRRWSGRLPVIVDA